MNLYSRRIFCWRLLFCVIIGAIFPYLSFAAVTEQSGKSLLSNSDSASWKQTRFQHRRLPTEDILWTVNGKDMLWNFKNLHQLFPTANVYKADTQSELEVDLKIEITCSKLMDQR